MNESSETPALGAYVPVERTLHVGAAAIGMRIVVARGLSLVYIGETEDDGVILEVASDKAGAEEAE